MRSRIFVFAAVMLFCTSLWQLTGAASRLEPTAQKKQERVSPHPGVSPARPDIQPPVPDENWYCQQCQSQYPFPKRHYKEGTHRPMLVPRAGEAWDRAQPEEARVRSYTFGAATHGRNPEEAFSQHPRGPAPHSRGTGRGRNAHSHRSGDALGRASGDRHDLNSRDSGQPPISPTPTGPLVIGREAGDGKNTRRAPRKETFVGGRFDQDI